jgi:diguanylate cyclase (GGDEF)-like protein
MTLESPRDRQLRLHWRLAVVTLLLVLPLNIAMGSFSDRLLFVTYAIVTLVAWWWSKNEPVWSVVGQLAAAYGVLLVSFLDSHGSAGRLALGPVGFAALTCAVTYATSAYFGRAGLISSVIASLFALVFFKFSPATFLAAIQLGLGMVLGFHKFQLLEEMAAVQKELQVLATRDALTNLENRRGLSAAFDRYVALASRQNVPLLLSVWDVNDLKSVNDNEGHAAGDAQLKAFAQALLKGARSEDAFFRIGGDEFVGLHLGLEDGQAVIDRVQSEYADVAAGWAPVAAGLEATLEEADIKLYRAKAQMRANATLEELEANG